MSLFANAKMLLVGLVVLSAVGCIKGPLWRTGYASPWARKRWAEEERIAQSIYSRRDEMAATVETANRGTEQDRQRAAENLGQIAANDSAVLVRQEAVKLLGKLDNESARAALRAAAQDPLSEIRMSVVFACGEGNDPEKLQILQGIVGADADIDVRLAATRALQNYEGPEAVRALSLALEDQNPALQLRATESLQVVTGEKLGSDIRAWQEYVRRTSKSVDGQPSELTAEGDKGSPDVLR